MNLDETYKVLPIVLEGLRLKIEANKTIDARGCWIWGKSTDTNGYPQLRVFGRLVRISRLSYEAFNGPIVGGMFVCHACDVRLCVNPGHLWLGTATDNTQDMLAKGRQARVDAKGERNGNAKLTSDDVVRIRTSSLSASEIAAEYQTTAKNIRRIRSGIRWPHIPFDANYWAKDDK